MIAIPDGRSQAGQSSPLAALIDQQATKARDREIADALNGFIETKLKQQRPTGTQDERTS